MTVVLNGDVIDLISIFTFMTEIRHSGMDDSCAGQIGSERRPPPTPQRFG